MQQATTELDAILFDIQRLLSINLNFSVSFIPRQVNLVFHILATKCLGLDACMDLFHVPLCVREVLFNEMT